jgi:carbon monoxide dehydrogenase subunit G
MVTVSGTVQIDRPGEHVFAFASDYENDPEWRSGVLEMRRDPPGEMRIGVRTHEVMRFMGRTLVTEAEVVEYEPGHKIVFRTVSGALSAQGYRLVEAEGTGTRFTYHADAKLDSMYRPFAALIVWAFNRRVARDLAPLKAILEAPGT